MRLSGFALLGAAALAFAADGAFAAEDWGTPGPAYARFGIRTIACDERTHDQPCLGLACIDGSVALVSAAGGGGPMDGPTRISTGRDSFTLRFAFDARALDRLGVAASRAFPTAAQFDILLAARSLTLVSQPDGQIRHRFGTRGLAREGERVAANCR